MFRIRIVGPHVALEEPG
jgi:hypothetical protein